MLAGLGTQRIEVEAGLRQLAGVADQPLFDARGIHFEVELPSHRVIAHHERLVRADRCRSQALDAWGQRELVAMPVQDALVADQRERRVTRGRRQGQRGEPDLLAAHRPHGRAKRTGHQLRAETDAQQRPTAVDALAQEADLLGEIGVTRVFLRPDRPAEDDEQIDRSKIERPQFIDADVVVVDTPTALPQPWLDEAQVFEGQVTHSDRRSRGRRFLLSVRAPGSFITVRSHKRHRRTLRRRPRWR